MGCAFHFNACSAQREGKSKILWREKTKREVGLFSQREKLLQEKGTKGGDEVEKEKKKKQETRNKKQEQVVEYTSDNTLSPSKTSLELLRSFFHTIPFCFQKPFHTSIVAKLLLHTTKTTTKINHNF